MTEYVTRGTVQLSDNGGAGDQVQITPIEEYKVKHQNKIDLIIFVSITLNTQSPTPNDFIGFPVTSFFDFASGLKAALLQAAFQGTSLEITLKEKGQNTARVYEVEKITIPATR